jgi:hypothetical protein
MITSAIILAFQITLTEVILFQVGAILLGFAINYFWTSRKSLPHIESKAPQDTAINEADEWRLKYYEQVDMQQKLEEGYKLEVEESRENEEVLKEEIRLMRMEKEKLLREIEEIPAVESIPTAEYLEQLRAAQENLLTHNQHINRLLEQIHMLKESERKYGESQKANEELHSQMRDLKKTLFDKESEIKQMKQQQALSIEVKERLDKAYGEFNLVQEKIQKVESYLVQPQNRNFEFDELQQSYFKLTKEFDEIKLRYISVMEENQRLTRLLADTEDKLRESNFQRQQLLRKVSFLEELNNDLQQVTEHNKKLETQLMRIGEIESLLAKLSGQKPDTGAGH